MLDNFRNATYHFVRHECLHVTVQRKGEGEIMVTAPGLALDVSGLCMRYGATDVLLDVTVQAHPGEVLGLLGPNGAGKTTTIEILEGFRMRSAGHVQVLGIDPGSGNDRWRARIGIVLQSWRDHARWRVRELLVMGLIAISGIFYPITTLPWWLQWIAEVFPIYWLGLGMRSAFLPATAAGVEIGASWRPLQTAVVLGAWAAAGLILAPIILGRMARRESGSRLAARREKTLQRIG
jgi:hypothetical protein